MIHGPNYPYSAAMNSCTLCNVRLKAVPALGVYLAIPRGAIHYPLCRKCIQLARKGLKPDQLRLLDEKLEARADELGLNKTQ